MRILAVEDDPDVGYLIRVLFKKYDADIILTTTAQEAMDADWTSIDYAAVDYMLPGEIDGVALAVMLVNAGIPSTMVTAAPGGASRRMHEIGIAIPIVPKPFTAEALLLSWGVSGGY